MYKKLYKINYPTPIINMRYEFFIEKYDLTWFILFVSVRAIFTGGYEIINAWP